ncbi:MAG: DsbA family protein, partial [Pseudomonadota bacterium]
VKQQLQANIEAAVTAGVFGSPSFVVEEQLFFGNDRLDFVKEALVA